MTNDTISKMSVIGVITMIDNELNNPGRDVDTLLCLTREDLEKLRDELIIAWNKAQA